MAKYSTDVWGVGRGDESRLKSYLQIISKMFDCITMGGTESTRTLSRTRALKRSVMATVPEPAFLEVKLVPIMIRYCAKFTFHVCVLVLAAVALNTTFRLNSNITLRAAVQRPCIDVNISQVNR